MGKRVCTKYQIGGSFASLYSGPRGQEQFFGGGGARKVQAFKLYFTIKHSKSNIKFTSKIRTIQDKHDIGEMAEGQIGLKWPSPI